MRETREETDQEWKATASVESLIQRIRPKRLFRSIPDPNPRRICGE
jgi:hypothetical protein